MSNFDTKITLRELELRDSTDILIEQGSLVCLAGELEKTMMADDHWMYVAHNSESRNLTRINPFHLFFKNKTL